MIEPEQLKEIRVQLAIGTEEDIAHAIAGSTPSAEQGDEVLREAIIRLAPIEHIRLLCDAGFLPITTDGAHSAVHVAAESNRVDILELFLKHKKGLDCKDMCGQTPMFIAVYTGCYDAAEFLVKEGANVHTSATILDVKYDVEENPMPLENVAPLHAMAILSNRDVDTARKLLKLLAEAGADADVIDADKQKPEDYINPILSEKFRFLTKVCSHQN